MACDKGCSRDRQATPLCPPPDGRALTEWDAANCGGSAPTGSFQMRQHMIRNAQALIHRDRERVARDTACTPCFSTAQPGTMLPEESRVTCDTSSCRVTPAGAPGYGLGQGRATTPMAPVTGHTPFYPADGIAYAAGAMYASATAYSTL